MSKGRKIRVHVTMTRQDGRLISFGMTLDCLGKLLRLSREYPIIRYSLRIRSLHASASGFA